MSSAKAVVATLTNWARDRVYRVRRCGLGGFKPAPAWGWNDMDTLDVGDGALDGLSDVEKQSAITILGHGELAYVSRWRPHQTR